MNATTAAELLRLAAEHPDLDLADDVDDAMPSTVTVKGLRAAEEA